MPVLDPADDFDALLARSLAPPERMADARFIARVDQQIQLDALRRISRSRLFERLGVELLSIVGVSCGLLAAGVGTKLADSAGNFPATALAGMVILFSLWVTVVSRQEQIQQYSLPLQRLNKLN